MILKRYLEEAPKPSSIIITINRLKRLDRDHNLSNVLTAHDNNRRVPPSLAKRPLVPLCSVFHNFLASEKRGLYWVQFDNFMPEIMFYLQCAVPYDTAYICFVPQIAPKKDFAEDLRFWINIENEAGANIFMSGCYDF